MASRPTVLQVCHFCKKGRTTLRKCHRCRAISYCSKLCQQEDWRTHQRGCKVAQAGSRLPSLDFLKTEEEKKRLTEILLEIYTDLGAWLQSEAGFLLQECVNRLDLNNDLRNAEKYVLRVVVTHTPPKNQFRRSSSPTDLFTITKIEVLDVKYAERCMPVWKECMQELAIRRKEMKAKGPRPALQDRAGGDTS
ncbi:hypothetical protein ONZ45_g7885 [Pleurotus djamor]|nr:hypothetical protein ONZ45_g7885 [Pleurotus djamor]